jgi:hypothetical protein
VQIKEKEEQACTFKPQTNEARNRELVRRVLSDSLP